MSDLRWPAEWDTWMRAVLDFFFHSFCKVVHSSPILSSANLCCFICLLILPFNRSLLGGNSLQPVVMGNLCQPIIFKSWDQVGGGLSGTQRKMARGPDALSLCGSLAAQLSVDFSFLFL